MWTATGRSMSPTSSISSATCSPGGRRRGSGTLEKKRPFVEIGRKIISGEHPPPPVGQTVGFRIVEIAPDQSAFEMEAVASRHANPMGTLHGGILCDLSDGAMGMAWAS